MKVAIRGIIGAGKTTFAAEAAALGWPVSYEPVEENPYLNDFYAGDNSVVFPMEMYLALARHRQFKAVHASPTRELADRSPEEDLIFAQLLHEEERLALDDYHDYIHFYGRLFKDLPRLDVIIWLKVSPETALGRIRSRGRKSEMQVSDEDWLEYLTRLHDAYEAQHLGDNVMVVDWETPRDVTEVLAQAQEFYAE